MGRKRGGAAPDAERFPCTAPGCSKTFTRKDHLRRHSANHDPHRRKTCPECGKAFARQDVLTAHLRKHEEEVETESRAVGHSPSPAPSQDELQPAPLPELGSLDSLDSFESMFAYVFSADSAAMPPEDLDMDWNSWVISEMPAPLDFDQDLTPRPSPPFDFTINALREPVSPAVCQRLLNYLVTVPNITSSPYFTPEAISLALEMYWTHFAEQVPILHRPTFLVEECSTGLLATLITIGMCMAPATEEGDRLYALGVSIASHLRALILLWETQTHPIQLSTFQALCLLGVASQQLLDRGQHIYSIAFSAFELSLGRTMDLFSYRHFSPSKIRGIVSPEARWRAWIELESFRRLAYLIIMRDAQLCSMFRNLPARALSVFLIRIGLPAADEASWRCTTASTWAVLPAPRELTLPQVLKGHFSTNTSDRPTPTSIIPNLSPFSQLSVVHGLMATAWDLRWRGSLRAPSVEAAKNWRASLEQAYEQHRRHITTALMTSPTSSSSMRFSALDMLLVGELDLRSDFVAIQTFAGATEIAGRRIGPDDYTTAAKGVRKWATSIEAMSASSTAMTYLLTRLGDPSFSDPSVPLACNGIYAPFSLYIAALTVWAFSSVQPHFAEQAESQQSFDLVAALQAATVPSSDGFLMPPELKLLLETVLSTIRRSRWGLAQEYSLILKMVLSRR